MSEENSLEEQNINNIIEFYKAELRQVLEGASGEEVFNASERARANELAQASSSSGEVEVYQLGGPGSFTEEERRILGGQRIVWIADEQRWMKNEDNEYGGYNMIPVARGRLRRRACTFRL